MKKHTVRGERERKSEERGEIGNEKKDEETIENIQRCTREHKHVQIHDRYLVTPNLKHLLVSLSSDENDHY